MSKVYVVQQQLRRNPSTGELEPLFNLEPATDFGELVPLLGHQDAPYRTAKAIAKLHEGLRDFTADDYLLLIGNPCFIGWATAIAAHYSGGSVRHLQWHGRSQSYVVVEAAVFG